MTDQISLTKLPLTVLDIILDYLDFTDIFKLRCTCKYFDTLCTSKIKLDIKKLKKSIISEIKKTTKEAQYIKSFKILEGNLKYKYILRILKTEINLVNIIFRQCLLNDRSYYALGSLIDDFKNVFNKVRSKSVYSWSEMKIYSKKIQHKVTLHLNGINQRITNYDSMGIQMVDLLNMTKNTKYSLKVKYNTQIHTCHIKAKYNIENVKILNFLPDLSVVTCVNNVLTNEEKGLIINFFSLLIRVHNYFFIQDQHYQERIKIYNRKESQLSLKQEEINLDTNDSDLKLKKSEPLSEYEFEEIYKNIPGILTYSGKGLWFEITLKCGLSEAPLKVLKKWNILASKLGKKSTDSINSEKMNVNHYNIFIKFKKYLSDNLNCINIIQN